MANWRVDAAKNERSGNARGILLIIFAVAGFSCMDAAAKWLNSHEHVLQTVAVRYVGSFLVTVIFLNPYTRPGIFRSSRPRSSWVSSAYW